MRSIPSIRRLALVLACLVAWRGAPLSSQQSIAEQFANAKRLFETLNYEQAAQVLDQIVAVVPAPPIRDAAVARTFAAVYELRARSRFFLGDEEGARSDFRAMLRVAPARRLTQVSAKVRAIFDETLQAGFGQVRPHVTPPDAALELDGVPFDAADGPIAVPAAGTHTISATRAGCRPASRQVRVEAGTAQDVTLALERTSASLRLVSSPAGVEIVVDGASRGRTASGTLPPEYAEWLVSQGLAAQDFSSPFVLDDLAQGEHVVRFQQACYTTVERRVSIDRFDDFRLDPVRMEPAVASIRVETSDPGGAVFLDGKPRGSAPLTLDGVCEGGHVVEVRSPDGRHVERLAARTGDRLTVQARVRPAVALLGVNGLPEGYRGPDPRVDIERALANVQTVTVFAPPEALVRQALAGESLAPGWLSFDKGRHPVGAAAAMTGAARLDLARRLARALDVQALAEVTVVPGGGAHQYLLTVLAADSATPDVLEIRLEQPSSVGAVVRRLNALPPLFRPTAGVSLADVLDVAGPVVIGVDAAAGQAGLSVGDVIAKLDGQPVADASGFGAVLEGHKANDTLVVEARDGRGTARRASLVVRLAPRVLAPSDDAWSFNGVLLGLKAALPRQPEQASVVRLNLAVALMHLGNWTAARDELRQVQLPGGAGVSNGTVQYLLGLCYEALGEPAEAVTAWQAAAAEPGSLLTEDGPPLRDLAERKLAGPAGR